MWSVVCQRAGRRGTGEHPIQRLPRPHHDAWTAAWCKAPEGAPWRSARLWQGENGCAAQYGDDQLASRTALRLRDSAAEPHAVQTRRCRLCRRGRIALPKRAPPPLLSRLQLGHSAPRRSADRAMRAPLALLRSYRTALRLRVCWRRCSSLAGLVRYVPIRAPLVWKHGAGSLRERPAGACCVWLQQCGLTC